MCRLQPFLQHRLWISSGRSYRISRAQIFAERVNDEGSRRSEEHTSELQSRFELVCRPLLEKKNCWCRAAALSGWVRLSKMLPECELPTPSPMMLGESEQTALALPRYHHPARVG